MKEKLYTIPVNDAVSENDECPLCFIERKLEQDALDFTLGSGSSYMESDIREETDRLGFCREHTKKMFDYGNALGNALILKTHYQKLIREMKEEFSSLAGEKPQKRGFLRRTAQSSSLAEWAREKDCSCFICQNICQNFDRYLESFFYLYRKDAQFREKIENGKGFCLHHFGILCDTAGRYLSGQEQADFYRMLTGLMETNFTRMEEDISWLADKFDYRNKDADWKNSRDALQRGMQKLRGGYPADPPYRSK